MEIPQKRLTKKGEKAAIANYRATSQESAVILTYVKTHVKK